MYHGSRNYGGLLQAYALCEFLNIYGFCAKQIDLPAISTVASNPLRKLVSSPWHYLKKLPCWAYEKLQELLIKVLNRSVLLDNIERNEKIDSFRTHQIPHVDFSDSINDEFDVFICGSDQIWNPYAFRKEYFLEFAQKNKKRFAYAASIAKKDLPQESLEKMKPLIDNLDYVSVREISALNLLRRIEITDAIQVLDPTMLLDEETWKEKAIKPNIKQPYLFYYVLEDDKKKKRLAKKIAEKYKLELIEIPMADNRIKSELLSVKSNKQTCVDPFGFLGLIHNAQMVITDSFHATVFAILFKKCFYALECKVTDTLYPRIEQLLKIFDIEKNYIKNDEIDHLDLNSLSTEYSRENSFHSVRHESRAYLINSINDSRE